VNREILDPFFYATVAEKFSVHAEEAAIARIQDLRGAVLYVARINNQGEPRMSKPCDGCQGLIDKSGIKKVIYTNG
jgi:deoxycytidylate deaminase